MLGLFEGLDPKYGDYLVSGIVDYINGRILIAKKGEGVYILDIVTGIKTRIPVAVDQSTDLASMRVRVDGWFEVNLAVVGKLKAQGVQDIS